jgi:PAS domain-containing protein
VTALARFDTDGGLSCINGLVEDITGQKLAEHGMQIANKQMQDILACIPDPVVIVDNTNAVIGWNAAMEQLTGIQKISVLGRKDYDRHFPFYDPGRSSLPDFFDLPDAELGRYYPGAYREGTTIIAHVGDPAHHRDPASCFTIRASPLQDPQGARIGAVQIIQPVLAERTNRI